jgi:hypothetical protein
MSSPSAADGPAAWDHGLSPVVLKRLRLLIRPFDAPPSPTFNRDRYARLYKASPSVWGTVLQRYALFQRLKRREGETEAAHRARQDCWLSNRREWEKQQFAVGEHDIRTMWPDDTMALGTWFASPEEFAGSELELLVPCFPTGRVLVLDIASDKALLLARISELIDCERAASGIVSATRRGPRRKIAAARTPFEKEPGIEPRPSNPELDWRPEPPRSEYGELLRAVREHHIVPLWDLQLAGVTSGKHAMATVLYGEITEKRSLLAKLRRAQEIQDEATEMIARLRASVGTV